MDAGDTNVLGPILFIFLQFAEKMLENPEFATAPGIMRISYQRLVAFYIAKYEFTIFLFDLSKNLVIPFIALIIGRSKGVSEIHAPRSIQFLSFSCSFKQKWTK